MGVLYIVILKYLSARRTLINTTNCLNDFCFQIRWFLILIICTAKNYTVSSGVSRIFFGGGGFNKFS
jgi:hypothetical protein